MNRQSEILQLKSIRKFNRRALLRELHFSGPMSRVELAQRLKCDGTTITRGIRNLMSHGLVREIGPGENKHGRPRTLLELNSSLMKAIGIEISPGRVVGIVADLSGKILIRDQIRFKLDIGRDELLGFLDDLAGRLLKEVPREEQLGIAIAIFGHFHRGSRVIETAAGFPAIEHTDIEKHFVKHFKIKPEIINGTLALAYSQTWFRRLTAGTSLMIYAGHGIGSVVTIDGKTIISHEGHPGEFGHTVCDINGLPCSCGRRGCLETVSSIPALLKQAAAKKRNLEFEELCDAWSKDPVLETVVNSAAAYLAVGIGNMIHITMPDRLILSGELLNLGEVFVEKLKKELKKQVIPPLMEKLEISIASFDNYSTSLGAASTIIGKFFE
jgi:predicted NBD/HSP70 family sugar kinase